jgi:hypothetical protein
MVAVFLGIWVYSRITAKRPVNTFTDTVNPNGYFYGPDVDPITGAYKQPGAQVGTVGFTSAPVQ